MERGDSLMESTQLLWDALPGTVEHSSPLSTGLFLRAVFAFMGFGKFLSRAFVAGWNGDVFTGTILDQM